MQPIFLKDRSSEISYNVISVSYMSKQYNLQSEINISTLVSFF